MPLFVPCYVCETPLKVSDLEFAYVCSQSCQGKLQNRIDALGREIRIFGQEPVENKFDCELCRDSQEVAYQVRPSGCFDSGVEIGPCCKCQEIAWDVWKHRNMDFRGYNRLHE